MKKKYHKTHILTIVNSLFYLQQKIINMNHFRGDQLLYMNSTIISLTKLTFMSTYIELS